MVLGAGYLQVPLIARAVGRGYHVITVDYLPGNVGHRIATEWRNISTIDCDAVLEAARDMHIDSIVTACTDVAMPTVGVVNEALGLHGVTRIQAETLCTKHKFREFQRRHNLDHPAFISGTDAEVLVADASFIGPEVVVKAVDRSGSRGVRKVLSSDPNAVRDAVDEAQRVGLTPTVCIERVIPGIEHGGDAFILDGRVAFLCVTEKRLQGAVVRGHTLPSSVPQSAISAIASEIQRHVNALGYDNGPLNFDVMVDGSDTVRVIEMSPRSGGNWIPQLVAHVYGTDLFDATLDASLGIAPSLAMNACTVSASAYILGTRSDGKLVADPDAAALLEKVPGGVALEFNVRRGDTVRKMRDSGDQIGRVLFEHDPAVDFWSIAAGVDSLVSAKLQFAPEVDDVRADAT